MERVEAHSRLLQVHCFFRNGSTTPLGAWGCGAPAWEGKTDDKDEVNGGVADVKIMNSDGHMIQGDLLLQDHMCDEPNGQGKVRGDKLAAELTTTGVRQAQELGRQLTKRYSEECSPPLFEINERKGWLPVDRLFEVRAIPARRAVETAAAVITGLSGDKALLARQPPHVRLNGATVEEDWLHAGPFFGKQASPNVQLQAILRDGMCAKPVDSDEVTSELRTLANDIEAADGRLKWELNLQPVHSFLAQQNAAHGIPRHKNPQTFQEALDSSNQTRMCALFPFQDELHCRLRNGPIFVEGKKWESTEENPDEQLEQMLNRLNLAVARTYRSMWGGSDGSRSIEALSLGMGPLFGHSCDRFKLVIACGGRQTMNLPRICLFSGDQTTIMGMLLSILPDWGIAEENCEVPFCAELSIELWSDWQGGTAREYSVRALYNGKPLIHRLADDKGFCKWPVWLDLLRPYTQDESTGEETGIDSSQALPFWGQVEKRYEARTLFEQEYPEGRPKAQSPFPFCCIRLAEDDDDIYRRAAQQPMNGIGTAVGAGGAVFNGVGKTLADAGNIATGGSLKSATPSQKGKGQYSPPGTPEVKASANPIFESD